MPQTIDLTVDTPPPRPSTLILFNTTTTNLPLCHIPPSSSSSSSPPTSTFTLSLLPWTLRNPPTASLRSPLLRKRTWLQQNTISLPTSLSAHLRPSTSDPVAATLVFAHSEAGTAVCLSPDGVLLTCAHCVAESPAELNPAELRVLLFSSGAVVTARVVAWDPVRDLALLVVVETDSLRRPFPFVRLAPAPPKLRTPLLCIGHPGSEDLEASTAGVPTHYDTLVLSSGRFRGLAKGQDVQDNSEVGALAHTCWTYWGHSGAGLVDERTGLLVGMHSSWDEETGMRRGVAWEAIDAFLSEFEGKGGVPEGWRWCVR
ncbi:trypsin-like cysteine/serine peptidase domain-containing protein [Thelonectria olida]|uniref:Trypsin-like cysteine/serine peptidase domain-containing protein n=1 Tax=Thelonectria olida TaxID=1576542 RepID=A0A9P8WA50_9HYPO|nr:trypsin-like cysteine/serine peptidase domain-containing protein [Thelonectria olida]